MSVVLYRNVAIGTGILCLILIIGLMYTVFQVGNLNSQIAEIGKITNLEKTYVWIDHESVNAPSRRWDFTTDYAGYVTFTIQAVTTESTYIQVTYVSHGVSYDSGRTDVGSSGTVSFPVLPGQITIRVENPSLSNGPAKIVTAVLYY